MAENPYKDDVSRFCVTFTRAVIAWNGAEDAARLILTGTSKGSIGSLAAIAHIGSRSMDDALLTLADYWNDDATPTLKEASEHICHFIAGLDTLRGYRNFYVHSLRAMGRGRNGDDEFRGVLTATEARGRYAWITQEVRVSELETFMRQCAELESYGSAIANYLTPANALLPPSPKQPLSSLQKPTWPGKLKKSRRYLIER